MKKAVAWLMLVGSVVGLVLSVWPWRLFAEQEPVTVLALSWAALLFAAIDGLLIEHQGK